MLHDEFRGRLTCSRPSFVCALHSLPEVSSPIRLSSNNPADKWLNVLHPMMYISPAASRMALYIPEMISAFVFWWVIHAPVGLSHGFIAGHLHSPFTEDIPAGIVELHHFVSPLMINLKVIFDRLQVFRNAGIKYGHVASRAAVGKQQRFFRTGFYTEWPDPQAGPHALFADVIGKLFPCRGSWRWAWSYRHPRSIFPPVRKVMFWTIHHQSSRRAVLQAGCRRCDEPGMFHDQFGRIISVTEVPIVDTVYRLFRHAGFVAHQLHKFSRGVKRSYRLWM